MLGIFGKLLLCSAIVDSPYGFACLILKISQQGLQFLFQFADLRAPLLHTFSRKAVAFARKSLLQLLHPTTLLAKVFQLRMEAIEEAGYVLRLRVEL